MRFLQRNALAIPNEAAIVNGATRYSWKDHYQRCVRLANAIRNCTNGEQVTVAIMAPNIPATLEAHFAVPLAGAVLCCLNYRLDAATISFILAHAEVKILLVDEEFASLAEAALQGLEDGARPKVIEISDTPKPASRSEWLSYHQLLQDSSDDAPELDPSDEFHPISVNYTSGTTGKPKGVIYHYRGAYLSALGNAMTFGFSRNCRLLWTLPLFHCNGWSQAWALAAVGGTHVCLRKADATNILASITDYDVTHLSAAPVVLNMLASEAAATEFSIKHTVQLATGGAPPPSTTISKMEKLGFRITHLYGLTETFGPSLVCERQAAWDDLDDEDLTGKLARQGIRLSTDTEVCVRDSESLAPVPWDGKTVGEIMVRSNGLMVGYLKNPEATSDAFTGGWFHTGDLAVVEEDGFIRITDRIKDVIISGGENVSSVELEEVLYRHPSISEVAVVAMPSDKWGESPCAFVSLYPGTADLDVDTLTKWCRQHMASFKLPRAFVFGELPKTATGKIQKFKLREVAAGLSIQP